MQVINPNDMETLKTVVYTSQHSIVYLFGEAGFRSEEMALDFTKMMGPLARHISMEEIGLSHKNYESILEGMKNGTEVVVITGTNDTQPEVLSSVAKLFIEEGCRVLMVPCSRVDYVYALNLDHTKVVAVPPTKYNAQGVTQ